MLNERMVAVKKEIINSFIKEHFRSPTQQELKALINNEIQENVNIEKFGLLSGQELINKSIPGKESSCKNFNKSFNRLKLNKEGVIHFYKGENLELENKFRIYTNSLSSCLKDLRKEERKVNKELILRSKSDIYNYGIVENFSDYNKVDFNKSNVYFLNGRATLGFSKVTGEPFSPNEIKYSVRSKTNEVVTSYPLNDFNNITDEDGSFFKLATESSKDDDVVDFIVDIKLNSPKYIDTLKFVTEAIETNSKMSYKCFYSKDEIAFTEVFESSIRLQDNENYVEINKENVRLLRLVLTKRGYDYRKGNRYVYLFALDFLGLTKNKYKINSDSILYLGPYEILDEEEKAIDFSLATIKVGTCCIVPDKTSVDIFLSKDNVTWQKIDFNDYGKEVIQFQENVEDISGDSIFSVWDSNSTSHIIENNLPFDINSSEKILNYYISEENKNKFIKETLKIKRNVCQKSNQRLYGTNSGWYKEENRLSTYFEIKSLEGKYINLGNTGAILDGRNVTGKVFVSEGLHKFETNINNYVNIFEVESGQSEYNVLTANQLRNLDPLYPYNHKYIIEGFQYNENFIGRKVYKQMDKNFSFSLKEVSSQRFSIEENLENYTLVNFEGKIFIKVKNKENSSEIMLEEFDISCKKRNNANNENLLYIKAILNSSDVKVTPKIDQIQVRVI